MAITQVRGGGSHGRDDPAVALAEIQRHRATVFDGVPTMYAMMLADPSLPGTDLSSLRICTVGGQTMPAAKMAEWERRSGVSLLEIWGMTELAGAGTSNCSYMPNVLGSIGFVLPGAEARIAALNDPGVPAPPRPRPRSPSIPGGTWRPTSCPARSGSCPTCPRLPPARSCAGS